MYKKYILQYKKTIINYNIRFISQLVFIDIKLKVYYHKL